jgi:hypothetical protein
LRRLRRVAVTGEFFVETMKHGLDAVVIVDNALPEDTVYVGATFDPASLVVWLIVESATFDEVPESAAIPEHKSVVFRKRDTIPVHETVQ